MSEPTYETLVETARRYWSVDKIGDARDSAGAPIHLEPLLDLIAQHIDRFAELVPAPKRKFFALPGRAKLTSDQVRKIRASTDKIICIAEEFGVSTCTVSKIRTGKQYRSVR